MIVRDNNGLIVQHPSMDGGDTLSRTGIMALCGSVQDRVLLPQFHLPGLGFVRHPYQAEWNKPALTSRDQIVCAGGVAVKYADKGWVNKDYLDPGVRLYLYTAAFEKAPIWIRIVGRLFLLISLVWNTKIKPEHEMNQFACICIVMGPWYCQKLIEWHPDINENMREYWSGWRDQAEIGEALLKKLYETAGAR